MGRQVGLPFNADGTNISFKQHISASEDGTAVTFAAVELDGDTPIESKEWGGELTISCNATPTDPPEDKRCTISYVIALTAGAEAGEDTQKKMADYLETVTQRIGTLAEYVERLAGVESLDKLTAAGVHDIVAIAKRF